jgi:hypothetical protein
LQKVESVANMTQDGRDTQRQSRHASLFRRSIPYIIVLSLAIFGVAYTNVSQQPLFGYWEFLALAIGVVSVVTQWGVSEHARDRKRLIWTQALHWATVLFTMNVVLLPGIQRMLPAPASGLVLLALLALGTFLAGVNLLSMEISFLGLAMALAVPAIAWLKQSALLLFLAAVFFVGLYLTLRRRRDKEP